MKRIILLLLVMAGLLFGCSPEELDPTMESTALKAGVNEKSTNDVFGARYRINPPPYT